MLLDINNKNNKNRPNAGVLYGAVAIQTGCRAACREQTAAEVLEATLAVRGRKMVERLVYKKDPVTPAPLLLKLDRYRIYA